MSETPMIDAVAGSKFVYFKEWTCVFPGKMGISWKRAWDGVGTKEEAEVEAAKHCNTCAIPLRLWEKMKEHEAGYAKNERIVNSVTVKLKNASYHYSSMGGPLAGAVTMIIDAVLNDLVSENELSPLPYLSDWH